jgi:hypothetical protein
MGWWSAAVMGGDTPLDMEAHFLDIAGIGGSFFDRFDGSAFSKENITEIQKKFTPSKIDKMVEFIEKEDPRYFCCDDKEIAYQTLGVVMMRFGVPISDALMGRMLEAAMNDEWSQQDDERANIIVSFIDDLLAYETKPTELTVADQGLFAKFAEVLGKS